MAQGKLRGDFEDDDIARFVPTTGNSWFLGIGINEYQEFPPLLNAVKDVTDLKDVLLKQYDLDEDKTILLLNEKATEENIINELDRLVEDIEEDDKLLIYFSGHGDWNKKTGLCYWMPYNARKGSTSRHLRDSTIRDYIKVIKARHVVLMADSCFSGSLFARGGNRSTDSALDELETISSRWAICSGRYYEEPSVTEPGKNSPFAESILNSLGNNLNWSLNIAKLADNVLSQNKSLYEQPLEGNPLYGVGHKGGQYIFRRKTNEEEDWASCLEKGSPQLFQLFINKYPESQHVEEAKNQIVIQEEEVTWSAAKTENTIQSYFEYDKKYPNGRYNQEALTAIHVLEEEKEWQLAIQKNTLYSFRKYTMDYPDGKYKAEAYTRIQAIIENKPLPSPPPIQDATPEPEIVLEAALPPVLEEKEALETTETQPEKQVEPNPGEEKALKEALKEDSISGYKFFLVNYPNGKYAERVDGMLKKKEAEADSAQKKVAQAKAQTLAKQRNKALILINLLAKIAIFLGSMLIGFVCMVGGIFEGVFFFFGLGVIVGGILVLIPRFTLEVAILLLIPNGLLFMAMSDDSNWGDTPQYYMLYFLILIVLIFVQAKIRKNKKAAQKT